MSNLAQGVQRFKRPQVFNIFFHIEYILDSVDIFYFMLLPEENIQIR